MKMLISTAGMSRMQIIILSIFGILGLVLVEVYLLTHNNLSGTSVLHIGNRFAGLFESISLFFEINDSKNNGGSLLMIVAGFIGFIFSTFGLFFDFFRVGLLFIFLWLIIHNYKKINLQQDDTYTL